MSQGRGPEVLQSDKVAVVPVFVPVSFRSLVALVADAAAGMHMHRMSPYEASSNPVPGGSEMTLF